MISPGYLEAMGIRLLTGRLLDHRDTPTSSAGAAREPCVCQQDIFPPTPSGRRLPADLIDGKDDWEVAGIVEDIRTGSGLTEPIQPEMLVVYSKVPDGPPEVNRPSRSNASQPVAADRHRAADRHASGPTATFESVMTMEQRR